MSKFAQNATNKTTNISGNQAYRMTDRAKLVTQVLTSFFNEQKFYGDNSKEILETVQAVIRQDAAFVSKLAVFARREFNMRSIAHVLTACLAHEVQGKPFVRQTVRGIALRGDDVTELMAFYLQTFGKPVPNALKKGINDVLAGFDEYTLAKYKGEGKTVKMRDLLCLCRPTPKDEAQSAMWKRCIEGSLETPLTWETELSAAGNNRETWERLIESGKVGYMALLRNLRSILLADPSNVEKVFARLEDRDAVLRSRQLPFRFLSAYRSVMSIAGSRVLDVLETAAEASLENLPKLSGTTVIGIDVSGSMTDHISYDSDVRCSEIALLLGLIANRICENAIVYTFDTTIEKLAVSRRADIISTTLSTTVRGGGTNMFLPFHQMLADGVRADRVIILSDNQCNVSCTYLSDYYSYYADYLRQKADGALTTYVLSYHDRRAPAVQALADLYRRKTGLDTWVHAIDLQGYGTQQFCGPRTNIIAGWSEKVFQFITLAEQGDGNLEKTIAAYEW